MAINWLSLFIGLVLGIVVTGIVVWKLMPSLMLVTHESKLLFDETVETFIEYAEAAGWQLPKVYELQNSLAKAVYKISSLKVISICNPKYALQVLEDDENKVFSAIMPCRIGIYQTTDGKVYISEMNILLMSKMFRPRVARAMASLAAEENAMLDGIVAHH